VTAIFGDLRTQASAAVEQVIASLPKAFPAEVTDSISNGFMTRLRRLEDVMPKMCDRLNRSRRASPLKLPFR
jgi:hypothetical protein